MYQYNNLKRKSTGFTLIETLIVLFCLTILIMLSVTFYRLFHSEIQQEELYERFVMTMIECQTLAKANGRRTRIEVSKNNEIIAYFVDGEEINRWSLPNGTNIRIETIDKKIEYTPNGTISRLGNIHIETPTIKNSYTIIVHYGRLKYSE